MYIIAIWCPGHIENWFNKAYWSVLNYKLSVNLLDRKWDEENSNQNLMHFNWLHNIRGFQYTYAKHLRIRSK